MYYRFDVFCPFIWKAIFHHYDNGWLLGMSLNLPHFTLRVGKRTAVFSNPGLELVIKDTSEITALRTLPIQIEVQPAVL